MKILLVANGFPPSAFGGVESYVHNLAQSLDGNGHSILVFCRESDQVEKDYALFEDRVEGIRVIRMVNDFKQISDFADTYVDQDIDEAFKELLQVNKPDLIHFNHLIALSANLPSVAEKLNIPSIMTLHDYWPICHRVHLQNWKNQRCYGPLQGGDCYRCVIRPEKRRLLFGQALQWGKKILGFPLRRKLRQKVFKDAGSVIALRGSREDFTVRTHVFRRNLSKSKRLLTPSKFVKQVFQSNGYEDVEMEVLPLGIDRPSKIVETQEKEFLTLGYVGTLLHGKGAHILVDAVQNLRNQNVRLKIHGRDDADVGYAKEIHRIVQSDQRISFEGPFHTHLRDEIYKGMDVLVIPSLAHESFSLVARESLLRGVPVIASEVGALPEIIEHGKNGFLFPAGEVNALTGILRSIIEAPKFIHSLKLPGRVPILSIDEHVEALTKVYAQVKSG